MPSPAEKEIIWHGSSRDDLRSFPANARRKAGFSLGFVQNGLMPTDSKPMKQVGKGAYEIRIRARSGQYRVIYVAVIDDSVHVLHAFQKKTQKTPQRDIKLARDRYREID